MVWNSPTARSDIDAASTPTGGQVLLRGRDHPHLGACVVAEVDMNLAAAMSAGSTPKKRRWTSDPNEDAAAVLEGNGAAALAVADAHFGHESSERVIEYVLDALGDEPPDASLSDAQLVNLFFHAGVAVQRETTRADSRHPDTRTTLALALISSEAVQWAALGDSCVVVVGTDGGTRVDTPSSAFLGNRFTHADIAASLTRGRAARDAIKYVVCATDGLSHALSRRGLSFAEVVASELGGARTARQGAERLVTRALGEGVDDAVTVAVALC